MKYDCSVVGDLLPLYVDNVCSDVSKEVVAEHLQVCPACQKLYNNLSQNNVGDMIKSKSEGVINRQKKNFSRKSFTVGAVFAGIFMIPIVVCLIVNICVGSGLDWFFIVLTSLLLTASMTVLPLMLRTNKFVLSAAAGAASLMLLLLTCAIYTHGQWFFVAASSSLFGLSIVIMPFLVNCNPLKKHLNGFKAITVFTADTVLYVFMTVAIGFYVHSYSYNILTAAISIPAVVFAWAYMLICRYVKLSKLAKSGIITAFSGIVVLSFEGFVNLLIGNGFTLPVLNFSLMTGDNLSWIISLLCIVTGVVLILSGLLGGKRK